MANYPADMSLESQANSIFELLEDGGTKGNTMGLPDAPKSTKTTASLSSKSRNSRSPPTKHSNPAPAPNTPASELRFINISAPGETKDLKTRKIVRTHVARDFRRKQRQQQTVPATKSNNSSARSSASPGASPKTCLQCGGLVLSSERIPDKLGPNCPDYVCDCFSSHSSSSESPPDSTPTSVASRNSGSKPSPNTLMSATRSDPFSVLPVESDPKITELLDHYVTVVGPSHHITEFVTKLLPLAVSDPMIMHGVLCLASSHLSMHSGRDWAYRESMKYQISTIRQLSSTLAESKPSEMMSVRTMAGIMLLTAPNVFYGDPESLSYHLSGMESVIKMRGSMENLGLDGLLEHVIRWVDNMYASITETRPRFAHGSNARKFEKPPHSVEDLATRIEEVSLRSTGFRTLASTQSISTELIDVLEDMIELDEYINVAHNRLRKDSIRISNYLNWRDSIEDRLLLLQPLPEDEDVNSYLSRSYDTDLQEACRLASMVYDHVVFREIPVSAALHLSLKSRLRVRIMNLVIRPDVFMMHAEVLFWCSFMAGILPKSRDDPQSRKFLVTILSKLAGLLQMENWPQIENIMKKFLWNAKLCEGFCRDLWTEVEVQRMEEGAAAWYQPVPEVMSSAGFA